MTSRSTQRWDEPHTYTVEGRGPFPFDMLRRDCSWPATTADAVAMGETGKRRVTLTAQMARYVAKNRWDSFGWRVVDGFWHGFPVPLASEGENHPH